MAHNSLAALLVLVLLCATGTSSARPGSIAGTIGAASSCAGLTEPKQCDDCSDCTWCMGKGDIGTGCYAVHMARMLPKRFFLCDNDARSVTSATEQLKSVSDCVGAEDAASCNTLKDSCTWCEGTGNVGTACYPLAMARALPKRFFTCDNDPRAAQLAARDADAKAEQVAEEAAEEEDELLRGVSECVGVTDSVTCDAKNGCTWCLGTGGSGSACYPVGAARMLPKRFFMCDNDSRS